MINYSVNQNLKVPILLFFKTIKKVEEYKNYVPWCTDSWIANKKSHIYSYEDLIKKYPQLEDNKLAKEKLSKLKNDIKTITFDGSITVGFNILDFSYISKVVAIEPYIVMSITDPFQSNIFKKLDSFMGIKRNNA